MTRYQMAAGQETHAIEADFEVFKKMTPPGKTVHAGVALPAVKDAFTAKAPDYVAAVLPLEQPEVDLN